MSIKKIIVYATILAIIPVGMLLLNGGSGESGEEKVGQSATLWYVNSSNLTPVSDTWGVSVPSLTSCDTIETDGSGVFSCGSGGGGSGLWATTTDELAIYPSDTNDTVLVGTNATSSTGNIFEVNGNSLLGGYVDMPEITEPSAPSADTQRHYVIDNGGFPMYNITFPNGDTYELMRDTKIVVVNNTVSR